MFFKLSQAPYHALQNIQDNEQMHNFWTNVFKCENYVIGADTDWTPVEIKNMTQYQYSKWCLEYCKHKWATEKTIEGRYTVHFENKAEAIMFKLMMVGNG